MRLRVDFTKLDPHTRRAQSSRNRQHPSNRRALVIMAKDEKQGPGASHLTTHKTQEAVEKSYPTRSTPAICPSFHNMHRMILHMLYTSSSFLLPRLASTPKQLRAKYKFGNSPVRSHRWHHNSLPRPVPNPRETPVMLTQHALSYHLVDAYIRQLLKMMLDQTPLGDP